jgi:hypothetical protein
MFPYRKPLLIVILLLVCSKFLLAQRTYQEHSVLTSGNWYKFSVKDPGIYRIDVAFLKTLGFNTSSIPTNQLKIYGNGGDMLPENCGSIVPNDLQENSILVEDGGDGVFDGNDYILFFAQGPDRWISDSINHTFSHKKNLYSDSSYYYITLATNGKRIQDQDGQGGANITITSFQDHYFHELDTVNFLSSGKQWFGEEFAQAPGKTVARSFTIDFPNMLSSPATLKLNCVARSFGSGSSFTANINQGPVLTVNVPPVATGPYDLFALSSTAAGNFSSTGSPVKLDLGFSLGSVNAQGWLDWFEIICTRALSLSGVNQLMFRDFNSVGLGNTGNFIIAGASAETQVWDVSDPLNPVNMLGSLQGTNYSFSNSCSRLHEYVAFNKTSFLQPVALGRVTNQDIHSPTKTDFLIIAHPNLISEGQRLAAYHQQRDHLRTTVVTTDQVYNEFSSGSPDPTALRDYVKMFYDRAGTDFASRPKYLLLFGDASFDYKNRLNGNTNLVPAYESSVSLDPLQTYTSDDFFGFLDDKDDINGNGNYFLDIGIGRIPASNLRQAKSIVDKIIAYNDPKSLGAWRNETTFVADDEDANLHLQDAEVETQTAQKTDSLLNVEKIYLDAFQQQSNAAGARYPDANLAVNNSFFRGTLIWNYNGHGSYRRLAEEVILDDNIISTMNNANRLPLFITATCDVAPFDNPLQSSIGENLLLRENTGAIALMTTTRIVFAFSNRVINQNYLATALAKKPDGTYLSLGSAVKETKNLTYRFFGDIVNNRKFTLLGDPALTLAFPVNKITTTSITNNLGVAQDTLKALSTYTVSGEVTDQSGNRISDFNGTIYPTVYDKVQQVSTRGNDASSVVTTFSARRNIIFKGKAQVTAGKFSYNFIVPKDIDYRFGPGRISYYGENGSTDGSGAFEKFQVGGSGDSSSDKEGPSIQVFLNDEKFISGGISNEKPLLIVKLQDSSGINIMGTGIGHDLVAIVDNDQSKQFILNEFYESDRDNYHKGTVRFQLPVLEDGLHTLTVKAWDVANNSNQTGIDFRIIKAQDLTLQHVLNYPNPFTTRTNFWFEHNRPGEELRVTVQIFTVSGKLVKTLRSTIITTGNRSSEVEWDGRDDYGNKIGRGVYIYTLSVQTSDGKTARKLEKLYLL